MMPMIHEVHEAVTRALASVQRMRARQMDAPTAREAVGAAMDLILSYQGDAASKRVLADASAALAELFGEARAARKAVTP